MMVRTGSFLVLLWSLCTWQVWASPPECDVEGLRCEIICSFPDLTLHCTRCLNRRPMRFGKRSKRSSKRKEEFPEYPAAWELPFANLEESPLRQLYDSDDTSSMAERIPGGWRPESKMGLETTEVKGLIPDHIPKGKYPRKYTFLSDHQRNKRKQHRDFPGRFPFPYPQTSFHGQLPDTISTVWSSLNEKLVQHKQGFTKAKSSSDDNENRFTRKGYANTLSPVMRGFSSLTPRALEALDQKFEGSPFSLNRKEKRITDTPKGYFPIAKRSKRSVQEVMEDLMFLLGLEELPVDPRLYGCQEVILPVSSDSYIVLNAKK
ncbi:uncharacterized protein LOC135219664 isoform X2 [Macrobrachium nipponense]|uniref:uncharacterized protein LOC135219664 isoform X2 n=1 Tax=Macrobrachium nipponense TaxID=159736 RepID=UPI0030C84985